MRITVKTVAERISDCLAHRTTLGQLVDWCEHATMEGEFETEDPKRLSRIVARLGVADERQFKPTWEELDQMLSDLGYEVQANLVKK